MASHIKPANPCYLKNGKAIGAQKDFAATFNWLVDWVSNIRGVKGVKIEDSPDTAHPKISLSDDKDGGGGGGGGDIELVAETGCNVTFRKDGGKIYVGVYWS